MGVSSLTQEQADRLEELVRTLTAYVPTEADAALVRRAEMERAEFLRRFPAETIADLTPAAYCIGHGDRDNFCWWIERGTNALSRYFPGSSRHYGLYWEKKSGSYWLGKELEQYREAHPACDEAELLRACLARPLAEMIRRHGRSGTFESVKAAGNAFLLKILILYYPEEFFQVNSTHWISTILEAYGLPQPDSVVACNQELYRFYNEMKAQSGLGEALTQQAFVRLVARQVGLVETEEEVPSEADTKEESNVLDVPVKQIADLTAGDLAAFGAMLDEQGLQYDTAFVRRFFAAVQAKRFVVLTGLSGSGKTQLAMKFCEWAAEGRWLLVPVGADWTNNEKMLGYADALNPGRYVRPETGVLDLVLEASEHPDRPYVLVLDEMNLSHVERYFADFLSAMESGGELRLHGGTEKLDGVPPKVAMPANLWVIGTMNVDETTYMFSPKVLDRAQVLEFRVKAADMAAFLEGRQVDAAAALNAFFPELAKVGAEFGYRTAGEFCAFVERAVALGSEMDEAVDAAVMQKLLPKLHGSRRQLEKPLAALWALCLRPDAQPSVETLAKCEGEIDVFPYVNNCRYPVSAEKIARLYKNAKDNGFASFAEA